MGLFTERDEETTNEIIIGKLNRIEAKLDAVIKAMHEYDDSEYGESSFEAFMDTKIEPCRGHDAASWDEEEMEHRMNIIGQNGNEGLHYDMGVNDDTQDKDKRVVGKKGKRKFNGNKNKG
jgi:hypothetical protein